MRRWLCCFVILALAGCSKQSGSGEKGVTGSNTIQLSISNIVNGKPMVLNDSTYYNAVGEAFTVTAFKYYLSNFSLLTTDGKTITLPKSYFLVNQADSNSCKLALSGIPDGAYQSLSFLIGVDSLTNAAGPQTGALDVVNGMYWAWNSGYINAKFEGTSPASTATAHLLQFHIGGFMAPSNTIRKVSLDLAQPQIWAGGIHSIQATADLYNWFDAPNPISFAKFSGTMEPNADAMKVADNYQQMFMITSITTP
ncbi:MAG TPA: MbnP family protein [Chitinophaga sp.]